MFSYLTNWNALLGPLRQDVGKSQNEMSYLQGGKIRVLLEYHDFISWENYTLVNCFRVSLSLLLWVELCSPPPPQKKKLIHWIPNPWYLRMWPYLVTGSLRRWSSYSEVVRAGPHSCDWCPYIKAKCGHRDILRGKTVPRDTVTYLHPLQRPGTYPFFRVLRGNQPCLHLDFGLAASKTLTLTFCRRSHPVNRAVPLQQTNTPMFRRFFKNNHN